MAQDWALRVPLVDGSRQLRLARRRRRRRVSLHGVPARAARDGAARASSTSTRSTCAPNYDGTTEEPTVLPARFPNLLVNGSTGIAVGMATNIPPHNLREIIDALHRARRRIARSSTSTLMKYINGPDFPTGGQMLNSKVELRQIYKDGQGTIRVRGEYKLEEKKRGGTDIVITSIPYAMTKARSRREDRRRHHLAEAAVPARRARRVDDRRPHRARDQEGRRSRARDGATSTSTRRCSRTSTST